MDIKVPALPESVADATVTTWHKKVGETIEQDEPLVDIETDKVVLEVVAPISGVLSEIFCQEGDLVTEAQVLGSLNDGEKKNLKSSSSPQKKKGPKFSKIEDPFEKKDPEILEEKIKKENSEGEDLISDASNQSKEEALEESFPQIDTEQSRKESLSPSQRQQALFSKDLKDHHQEQKPLEQKKSSERQRRVPMTRLRQMIAQRLLEAQAQSAMLTTFNEICLDKVITLRSRYKEAFEKTHGVKLGFMSLFTKAACHALKKYPEVNAYIDGQEIVYNDYCDISIAVSSPRGLVVPVLRGAENLTLAQIEEKIKELSAKARESQLSIEEMTGGTFTITNGGIFGSLLSTPILNPPQSAILGMHKIEKRPVVVNESVTIASMMYVALSYDHRIVDGKDSVQFLVAIKEALEDPERLLLDL
jgi:2-oxoglutarate dehydrogenase E2 component (dihydrolipoamide succinyltransferase)